MNDLIKRAIDWSDQPKKVLKVRDICDRILGNYNKKFVKPKNITLYDKDYRYLAEKLKEKNRDLSELTYQGYPLVSDVAPVTRISDVDDEVLYPWDEGYVEPEVVAEQLKQAEKNRQSRQERL